MIPGSVSTGILPIDLTWNGYTLGGRSSIRIIPAGPQVPVVVSVTDGINLLAGKTIASGIIKVTLEETGNPESFRAWIDGHAVDKIDVFCADPLPPRFEINLELPKAVEPGPRELVMQLGTRRLGPVSIVVTA
jgi:hypothetical protein